tara:strand:- start:1230 stop:1382 length:153 start_codon:yes stop_codon:yes gene_type:complete
MKIDKISFKKNQAWLTIKSNEGEYLGVWHVTNPAFVNAIRESDSKELVIE